MFNIIIIVRSLKSLSIGLSSIKLINIYFHSQISILQSPNSKNTTPKSNTPVQPTREGRKRHRLSQAHVRLERLNIDTRENVIVHRTRNALVAEFKDKNIMTRNRKSLEQIKSPTQRMEQLKKLTPTVVAKSPKSYESVSPSVTPLPKRRSVSDRSSPIPVSLKLLNESSKRNPTTKTNNRQTAATSSRIPTRTATNSSILSLSVSPTKRTSARKSLDNSRGRNSSISSNTNSKNNNNTSSQSTTKSRLPLRKSNRSASQVSLRKK